MNDICFMITVITVYTVTTVTTVITIATVTAVTTLANVLTDSEEICCDQNCINNNCV